MRPNLKTIATGCVFAGLAVIGCSSRSSGPGGGPEVVQAGYPADDAYYNQGAYDGDYWVWNDRDGHSHREARADHERRATVRSNGDRGQAGQRDLGNQREDAQRQNTNQNRGPAQAGGRNEAQPGARNDEHGATPSRAPAAEGRSENQGHGDAAGGREGDNADHR